MFSQYDMYTDTFYSHSGGHFGLTQVLSQNWVWQWIHYV